MSITINFGSVALQYEKPLIPDLCKGVFVWDGEEWVPWESGSDEEQENIRALVMRSPLSRTMPDGMRKVVLGG